MPKADLHAILAELRRAGSFLITSHTNPDGDAVGSTLAAYHLLRAMGKEAVRCVNDDPVPRLYQWLPGADQVQRSDRIAGPVQVDVILAVDGARKARLGKAAELCVPTARSIAIDHHLEEHPEGDLVFIDPTYSAVGEILYELFVLAGAPLSREAATCLYVSITTDTGGFRFTNTTPRSHRIAAALLEAGVDAADVSARVFDVMSVPKSEMLRRALDRMRRAANGRLAYSILTAQDMEEAKAQTEDTDGLVNFARNIEGVDVGILFRELGPNRTKVSMRARNPFNCARFLEPLGGGGHSAAAGVVLDMPLDEACARVVEQARSALGEHA
jgi:phosphoesterase RecJ-like protein